MASGLIECGLYFNRGSNGTFARLSTGILKLICGRMMLRAVSNLLKYKTQVKNTGAFIYWILIKKCCH